MGCFVLGLRRRTCLVVELGVFFVVLDILVGE